MREILKFQIPVLLVLFNREESLQALFGTLRKVKPSKVYIACDGPRSTVTGEAALVEDIQRKALALIDWPCHVETLFRKDNLGCKLAVSGAVQWFFSQVDRGIVLEDDCIPRIEFFEYCERLLKLYQNNYKVGSITGRNELGVYGDGNLILSSKFICWGWASWADRILDMDVEYGYQDSDVIESFNVGFIERLHVRAMRGVMLRKLVNSWAFAYDLGFRRNKQLCIVPPQNMVSNVGFGTAGTHSSSRTGDGVQLASEFENKKLLEGDFSLNSSCAVDKKFMSALILRLYNWPKLIAFSNIYYLYPLKPLYSNFKKLLKRFG